MIKPQLVKDQYLIEIAEADGYVAMLLPFPRGDGESARNFGDRFKKFLQEYCPGSLVDVGESDIRAGEFRVLIPPNHEFLRSEHYLNRPNL